MTRQKKGDRTIESEMIRRLKRRFILLTMTAAFLLLAIVVVWMNLLNYRTVCRDADEMIGFLLERGTDFPGPGGDRQPPGGRSRPDDARFFSVLLSPEGEVLEVDTDSIISVGRDEAAEYALSVRKDPDRKGFAERFRYSIRDDARGVRIWFLECGRSLDNFLEFLLISILTGLTGWILVGVFVVFFAGKIVHPLVENDKNQKRFIMDAGHELKTPLTVINANVDLMEMEYGEDENIAEIRQQTALLTSLTEDLMCLTRMEGQSERPESVEFSLSGTVAEVISGFRARARVEDRRMEVSIEPELALLGDEKAVRRLVSLLTDNALKYTPDGGEIVIGLSDTGKGARFTVENDTRETIPKEEIPRLFDRFYRADPSHNSETGGHGIGLSVAKAITVAHGGRIEAVVPAEKRFRITVAFPK